MADQIITIGSSFDPQGFEDAMAAQKDLQLANKTTAQSYKLVLDEQENIQAITDINTKQLDKHTKAIITNRTALDAYGDVASKTNIQYKENIELLKKDILAAHEKLRVQIETVKVTTQLNALSRVSTDTSMGVKPETVVAYNSKVEKAIQLAVQLGVDTQKVFDIWRNLTAGGSIDKVAGSELKVQEALMGVLNLEKRINTELTTEAANRAKIAQLARDQVASASRQAAFTRFVTTKVNPSGVSPLASPEAVISYRRAIEAANELVIKHKVNIGQLHAMWAQVQRGGPLTNYKNELFEVQQALVKINTLSKQSYETMATGATKAKKEVEELNISWQTIQRMLSVHVGYMALGRVSQNIRESFETAKDLEIRLAEIQTITQNMPVPTAIWRKELVELSSSFGIPVLQEVEAAYQAISNQVVDSANAMQFMVEANRLAVATNATVDQSVSALSSVINAFGLQNEDVTRLSAILFKTVELGRVRLDEMANTLGRSAVTTGQLGISFEDLAAQIAMLTVKGFPFEHAQTQILGLMQALLKPTKEMEKALKSWGFTTGQEAVKALGFVGVMKKMGEYTKDDLALLSALVPRVRGLSEALAFLGQGAAEYEGILVRIQNSQEYYSRAVELALNNTGRNLAVQQEKFKNSFLDTAKQLQSVFLDITKNIIGMDNVGSAMAVTLEAALIPAIGALTWALRGLILAANANPVIAALTVLSIAFVDINRQFNKSGEELSTTWYKTWKEKNDAISNLTESLYRRENIKLENSIKKSDALIAASAARITLAYTKTYDGLFDTLLERGITTGAKVKNLDFNFTEAMKPVMKELDKRLKESEDSVKRYQKTLEEAKKDIADFEIVKAKNIFEINLASLKNIPTKDNLEDINAQLAKLRVSYSGLVRLQGNSRDVLKQINDLENKRNIITSDLITEEQIQNLKKENEQLIEQRAAYVETVAKINKISATQPGKKNSRSSRQVENLRETLRSYEETNAKLEENSAKIEELTKTTASYKSIVDQVKLSVSRLKELEIEMLEAKKAGNLELLKDRSKEYEDVNKTTTTLVEKYNIHGIQLKNANDILKERIKLETELANQTKKRIEDAQKEVDRRTAVNKKITDATLILSDAQKYESIIKDPENSSEQKAIALKALKVSAEQLLIVQQEGINLSNSIPLFQQKLSLLQQITKEAEAKALADKEQIGLIEYNKKVAIQAEKAASAKNISGALTTGTYSIANKITEAGAGALNNADMIGKIISDYKGIWTPANTQIAKGQITQLFLDPMTRSFEDLSRAMKAENPELAQKFYNELNDALENIITDLGTSTTGRHLAKPFFDIQTDLLALTRGGDIAKVITDKRNLDTEAYLLQIRINEDAKKMSDYTAQKARETETSAANSALYIQSIADNLRGLYGVKPVGKAMGGVVEHFARGGTAHGTDTVPAMLTPGEFVVRRSVAQKYLPMLQAMNNARFSAGGPVMPRFSRYAEGGVVTNVGDINVSLSSSGNANIDVQQIGRLLKREIRRGTVSFA